MSLTMARVTTDDMAKYSAPDAFLAFCIPCGLIELALTDEEAHRVIREHHVLMPGHRPGHDKESRVTSGPHFESVVNMYSLSPGRLVRR